MARPVYTLEPDNVLALDGRPVLRLLPVFQTDKWDTPVPTMPPADAEALARRIVSLLNWRITNS